MIFRRKRKEQSLDYWNWYKKIVTKYGISVIEGEGKGARQAVEIIIQWAGKIDPMTRFDNALREIGIMLPVKIISVTKTKDDYMLCLQEIKTEKEHKVVLITYGAKSIIEIIQEEKITQKIVYDTLTWKVKLYTTEMFRISKIESIVSKIEIKGFLRKNEHEDFKFTVENASEKQAGLLFEQEKQIIQRIDKSINDYLSSNNEEIRVYKVYKSIKKIVSDFYDLSGATIDIEALGKMAEFDSKGELHRYSDKCVEILPYKSYVHKEYNREDGASVIYEYKKFKIHNVDRKQVADFMDEADNAIHKIETFDF